MPRRRGRGPQRHLQRTPWTAWPPPCRTCLEGREGVGRCTKGGQVVGWRVRPRVVRGATHAGGGGARGWRRDGVVGKVGYGGFKRWGGEQGRKRSWGGRASGAQAGRALQPVPSGGKWGWALAQGRAVAAATFDASGRAKLGPKGRASTKGRSACTQGSRTWVCGWQGRGWELPPGGFGGPGWPGVGRR